MVVVALAAGVAVIVSIRVVLPRLQLRAMQAAVEAATGLPCRVGRFSAGGRTARNVELGPRSRPVVRLNSLRFWSASAPYVNGVQISGVRLALPGNPEAAMPGLKLWLLNLEPLAQNGHGEVTINAAGELAEFNPLLSEHAGVRAERGRFSAQGRPRLLPDGSLSGELEVKLSDFLVRGVDGRFEVEMSEAAARIRLFGTLREPRFDLGALEPYLGHGVSSSPKGAAR